MADVNPADLFVIKVLTVPVYGTPVFRTLAGRSRDTAGHSPGHPGGAF